MGLVDYSESESESEAPTKAPSKTLASGPKKPTFQKVVERSNPGKIVVNLGQASTSTIPNGEPPAKRVRTGGGGGGGGGGLFSGFNSFLPPPKNTGAPTAIKLGSSSSAQRRPGIHLKTSSEAGFIRHEEPGFDNGSSDTAQGGMSLPPPRRAEPSIPDDLKPAEEVKLVGKPLMFKPLSVARNKAKKKTTRTDAPKASPTTTAAAAVAASAQASSNTKNTTGKDEAVPAMPPKKSSLFSLHVEEEPLLHSSAASKEVRAYEPLFETGDNFGQDGFDLGDLSLQQQQQQQTTYAPAAATEPESLLLHGVADDLNLSAAARRELFGRGGNQTAKKVINFNMDQEYRHNEELRAAGEQQMHNPIRAIQGGGKHSLRQLVHNVVNQQDALEESFAKGKSNRREASNKYGW